MNIEDYIRLFHDAAGCPGIITGPLDDLRCAECGQPIELVAVVRTAKPEVVDAGAMMIDEALELAQEREASETA